MLHASRPVHVGSLTLKNPFIMGSIHTGLEERRGGFEKLAYFYHQRAAGGVALIITGGIAPNWRGCLAPGAAKLTNAREVRKHRRLTEAVHVATGRIAMQILHAGRYAYHPLAAAPSAIKAAITPFKPWALSNRGIQKTIQHFVRAAVLAQAADYDGVEIMGSEGYLINQFIVSRTNHRTDLWGGSYAQRIHFAIEIVRQIRAAVDPAFMIIYRLSVLDLIEQGSTFDEVVQLAQAIEAAGASLINTGIGWHEARVPTIATLVPRAAFTSVTQQLKAHVRIPLAASNRLNTLAAVESVLSTGQADLVTLARPLLADPNFVNKALSDRTAEINTCIACNQACLDHVFSHQTASCLVNPLACEEAYFEARLKPTSDKKSVVVVGAGPGGMATALYAAQRGHRVTLIDAQTELGGQFNLAKQIPGKKEFFESIRYFKVQLEKWQVRIRLNQTVTAQTLSALAADVYVIATGVRPRSLQIPGAELPHVMSYYDLLTQRPLLGKNIGIIGSGGIGYDVAAYLLKQEEEDDPASPQSKKAFADYWGIDLAQARAAGGIRPRQIPDSAHQITMMQRSTGRFGSRLAKTTGWIHRQILKDHAVVFLDGVQYRYFNAQGLVIEQKDVVRQLYFDNVITCAGQVKEDLVYQQLKALGQAIYVVGGAAHATELDAKKAIRSGLECAIQL